MILWWWHGGFEVTLEDDDAVLLCLMTWSFDGGLTWWCFGGLVVGGSCAFLLYILPISWSLPPLRVGSLKPLLVGSKRTLAGSSERVGTLILVGAERSAKIEVFHIDTIVLNGFYQYTIEFSIHIWCLSSLWLIYSYDALMINKCGICYIRTSYKKLLGKVRKICKSVHTLIHPPSQRGCCVQHPLQSIPLTHKWAKWLCLPTKGWPVPWGKTIVSISKIVSRSRSHHLPRPSLGHLIHDQVYLVPDQVYLVSKLGCPYPQDKTMTKPTLFYLGLPSKLGFT